MDLRIEYINEYADKADLKKKVIGAYVNVLERKLRTFQRILADPKWASSGSEYHIGCRLEMSGNVEGIKSQIKILAPTRWKSLE